MPEDFVIKVFLEANRAEVKRMCITEYNEARHLAEEREEGIEEGYEKGFGNGEKKFARLILQLIDLGRNSEISKVASDSEYREKLYKEFDI